MGNQRAKQPQTVIRRFARQSRRRIGRLFARAVPSVSERINVRPADRQGRLRIRPIAGAIDDAMHRGRFAEAERLIDSALRLAPSSPAVLERLARLRLALGDPHTALAVLDGFRLVTASSRLLRLTCLAHIGRFDEALSELRRWAKRSTAPLPARRLLAMLEIDDGRADDALPVLYDNLRKIEDPGTLRMLIVVHHAASRVGRATPLVTRLLDTAVSEQDRRRARRFLASLDLLTCDPMERPSEPQIERLAAEFTTCEQAIEPLVRAQQRRPDHRVMRLVRAALQRCAGDLSDPAAARRAIAELSIMIANQDALELGRAGPATLEGEIGRTTVEIPRAVTELLTPTPLPVPAAKSSMPGKRAA